MLHIRRLPSLRTLSTDYLSDHQAETLVEEHADCPSLQLHTLEGIHQLRPETARLLVRISTLQRVEPWHIIPNALQLLAHGLPDLRMLSVSVERDWVDGSLIYDWPVVRNSVAACHQLTALALMATPLEELAALLLALPPSVRKLDILHSADFLHSDVFFTCVAEGGLRQLQQLEVLLDWSNDGEGNSAHMAAWLTRQRVCAPWIQAALGEWREAEEDSAP
jgi:hypothetical protein